MKYHSLLFGRCSLENEDDLWDDLPADGANADDQTGGLHGKCSGLVNDQDDVNSPETNVA